MKILSLACGIALTVYVGLVPAAEVSSGTELPAILGAVADYQPLNAPEMEKIQGERLLINGKVIWDWGWKRGIDININVSPKSSN
jgi:hypothetical protein